MTRESAAAKAVRYLTEGRLTVVAVDAVDHDHVEAVCRGSGELHDLGHDIGRGWWCSCPARGSCAHLQALQLVVVRRPDRQPGGAAALRLAASRRTA
jgi:hypothetical protein